ncbi:MAG: 4-phosphoerythronate dehydrogenase [Fibrobacterota bacterium]
MKIVADQNIPFVKEAFSTLGRVTTCAGEDITPDMVRDCGMLLVRSVTPVNEKLLQGSSVRFVATATIGTDHVDLDYLKQAGIGFCSAPGSNANSVAEYVLAALAELLPTFENKTIAVIGVGNVGSRVYRKAISLGMRALLTDPPKAAGLHSFVPLEESLSQADIVTVHVPLTYDGEHSTYGMINDSFLSLMKPGALLVNTSRGKTICEEPLVSHSPRLGGLVLDVWPREPEVSSELLGCTDIATPHIAGYSFDGKCTGTDMICAGASAFFFKKKEWDAQDVLDAMEVRTLSYSRAGGVRGVLRQAYPLQEDDRLLRRINGLSGPGRTDRFRQLRREYRQRPEFPHCRVEGVDVPADAACLRQLGFQVQQEPSA